MTKSSDKVSKSLDNVSKSLLDRGNFSFRDLIWTIMLATGWILQQYNLREIIHDEISNRLSDYRVIDVRLKALEAKGPLSNRTCYTPHLILEAILPDDSPQFIKPKFIITA